MKSRTRVSSATLVLVCVVLLGSVAHAQYRGALQGTVTDAQDAVIPGAKVSLIDKETNRTLEATTDESGRYIFNGLAPRPYKMEVTKDGFKKKSLDDIKIIAEQSNALNVQLDVGQVSDTVNVTDAAPLIDTATANISGTVTAENIQKLPSFGRDPFQLLQLAPGAFGDGARDAGGSTQNLPGTTIGGSGNTTGIFAIENGGQITANGARTGENNYQIDGVGVTSVSWGGTSVITPNEDSIKEVKVVTNNYDAENGRYRGAQVKIISQNGSNQYHGSAFWKADREGLNAFQRYGGFGKSPTRNTGRFNDFGGTVGGPIIKNKLFGFFSYETIRLSSPINSQGWYETSQFLSNAAAPNASSFLNFPGFAPRAGTIVDANHTCTDIGLTEGVNCATIPGQGLDLGRPLDPSAFPVGTSDPSYGLGQTGDNQRFNPGLGGDGTGSSANLDGVADLAFINNFGPNTGSQTQYNARVDFNLSSKDLIAGSFYRVPQVNDSFNGTNRLMNAFHHTTINEAETVLWNHTFSATLLNEARANAAGWRWKDLQNNPNSPWGLPKAFVDNVNCCAGVIGTIHDNSKLDYGIGAPGTFDQWTFAVKDTLTKVYKSHTIKMGGEISRLTFVDNAPWDARPNYYFNNLWDFLNDAPTTERATFNPVTGQPTDFRKDTRQGLYAIFAQDDYKVRPNLTINIGLRYEYFGSISEKRGNISAVLLGSGPNVFTDMRLRLGGTLYEPDKMNFGPQLGFAWSPTQFHDKVVVRGGFGIAYNGLDQAISLNGRSNPPFLNLSGNLTGDQIVYENSFPPDINSFYGYASNPATIADFDPNTHLPIPGPNFSPVDVTGYSAHWPSTRSAHYSLETQIDLGSDWVGTIGYQGSATRHLTRQYNLYVPFSVSGVAFNPVVRHVNFYLNDGTANFNALLGQLRHRFSRTFELDTQYRWSKSFDTGSNNFATGDYQYDPGTMYGPSDYDVTHAFKIYGIWSPTIFRGSRGWMEKIVGGWSISGILNAHSGYPWTPITNNACDAIYQGSCGGGGNGALRPVAYLGGGGSSSSTDTFKLPNGNFPNGGLAYFVPATVTPGPSFEDIVAGIASPGPIPPGPGIGRNSFRGPRYFGVDMTLSKAFGFPEMPVLGNNAKLEFRANFFNIFNKLNLANVQADINNPNFGTAQDALGGRTIELQARFSF
ncbi:MAG TPA: TonB-dependent receptor [Terriglobales bacterium]|jgi:Carboxypeptidase regulatory-like domain|nr:TonB-dependent receptor [Terriglobales bacterium]